MRYNGLLGRVVMAAYLSLGGMVSVCRSQDLTNLGGDLSSDITGRNAIQAAAPNVTDMSRVEAQAAGFPMFHRVTTPKQGLGPSFANSSCAGCHVQNGKGPASFGSPSRHGSSMIVKLKPKGLLPDGSAPEVPGIGRQALDQSISKPIKRTLKVVWTELPGRYADGTQYSLRKPKVVFPRSMKVPRGTIVSPRMSPPMIGMGLLEAISASDIVRLSDARDSNGDGISGRVNWVKDLTTGRYTVGRFGSKANHPTVLQQSAAALYHDMSITNPMFGADEGPLEASLNDLHLLAIYLRLAGVPKARAQGDPSVLAGKEIFQRLSCDSCHRMSMTTGAHTDPELSYQTIHPFTDLLLHDMGRGLADNWNEFSATGREWRTTPLWGLGFVRKLGGNRAVYLHDGRARSLEEAILWHGGEAAASQKAFVALPQTERRSLIDFLNSL